jgi:group I intron endonuclease
MVYVHINKQNGKRYVGITSKPKPEHRWNSGRGYRENKHFYQAIERYGWDGFDHIILYENLSEDQAKHMERALIQEWNTMDREFGYNMTLGGDGTPGYIPSEETRLKLSRARRRENLSDETLRRRSESLRGRKFSDDHKRKIGAANSKPIEMLTMDGELIKGFASAHDAEVSLGISHSHISQCCHIQRKSAGGFRWRFAQ